MDREADAPNGAPSEMTGGGRFADGAARRALRDGRFAEGTPAKPAVRGAKRRGPYPTRRTIRHFK